MSDVACVPKQIIMKETLKRVQMVLGRKKPTITSFRNALKTLSEQEREALKRDIFNLAFLYWSNLKQYQQIGRAHV